MPKESAFVQAMETVIAAAAPQLKTRGFRKRRHTFNRTRERGAVAVLNFQMGRSEPPRSYVIPGFRDNLYGQFTVNLGIAFEEMWSVDLSSADKAFPPFLNEYDCHVRLRLGTLATAQEDAWWPLKGDVSRTGREVAELIERFGLPWLDRFDTRRAILTAWEQDEPISPEREGRLPLVIALLYRHEGEIEQARRAFIHYYQAPHNPHHVEWLRGLAPRIGFTDLPKRAAEGE
jgi:hypothetical protein